VVRSGAGAAGHARGQRALPVAPAPRRGRSHWPSGARIALRPAPDSHRMRRRAHARKATRRRIERDEARKCTHAPSAPESTHPVDGARRSAPLAGKRREPLGSRPLGLGRAPVAGARTALLTRGRDRARARAFGDLEIMLDCEETISVMV